MLSNSFLFVLNSMHRLTNLFPPFVPLTRYLPCCVLFFFSHTTFVYQKLVTQRIKTDFVSEFVPMKNTVGTTCFLFQRCCFVSLLHTLLLVISPTYTFLLLQQTLMLCVYLLLQPVLFRFSFTQSLLGLSSPTPDSFGVPTICNPYVNWIVHYLLYASPYSTYEVCFFGRIKKNKLMSLKDGIEFYLLLRLVFLASRCGLYVSNME